MQTIPSTSQEKTGPDKVSQFKEGDVVIIEDIHPDDSYFKFRGDLVDEIFVVHHVGKPEENRGWTSCISPELGFHNLSLFPLFSPLNLPLPEVAYFAGVKLRHFSN
jgi:hypothetical protein